MIINQFIKNQFTTKRIYSFGLDINTFRKDKGNPEEVKESQRKRFKDSSIVDEIIKLDFDWKKAQYDLEQLKKSFNSLNKQIAQQKKTNQDSTEQIQQIEKINQEITNNQRQVEFIFNSLNRKIQTVGNIVHPSVPVSNNEKDNLIINQWKKTETKNKGHYMLLAQIDGLDMKRGTKISGHKGYFLKGDGALLSSALQSYAVQFLNSKGYTPIYTPFYMKKSIMEMTAQLSDFDDQLYKIQEENQEDMYLIATSEQPISAMHQNEWLSPKELPLKYLGISTCFRKEAGAHGKDIAGIFRVHQFEKIEQFIICHPQDSWSFHDQMTQISEDFLKSLGIPFRTVSIISGELNDAASKKHDIEGWFPQQNTYRELMSCSNCTDFQSRALGIRLGQKKQDEKQKQYVHMLNGTLCAVQRTLCCILENYQEIDGIKIPDVLVPFMNKKYIPFVKSEHDII